MKQMMLLFAGICALTALALALPGSSGVVLAATEVCNNAVDDDGDGQIDCLDADCSPKCQPLLDDPAKIRFRYPKRLDLFTLSGRGVPGVEIDPGVLPVDLSVLNTYGVVISQTLPPGAMIPNTNGTRWKYKADKTGSPLLYNARIIERFNKKAGHLEYLLKFRAEVDAWAVDPARNAGPTENELGTILTQVSVGPYVFYINALWDRIPKDTSSPVKGWKLTDKYMSAI